MKNLKWLNPSHMGSACLVDMSSTLFYVKQANIEHFRPGLRAHSTWRMCPLKPLQSCRNLHTTTLRARYSQCGIWAGTCADIRSRALHLGLLTPANSTHLRPLRSGGAQRCTQPSGAPDARECDHRPPPMRCACPCITTSGMHFLFWRN